MKGLGRLDSWNLDEVPEAGIGENHLLEDYLKTGKPLPALTQSPIVKATRERIAAAHLARSKRGQFGGITLGSERFHQLNTKWEGIDIGVHLVGGDSNIGKSACLRMMAWDISRFNKNVHVRFYTLDDGEDYFFSCFVAQAAGVPINAIHKPDAFINRPEGYYNKSDYIAMVERGQVYYERFMHGEYLEKFSYIGADSLPNGSEWGSIEGDILTTKAQLPADTQLVVFLDNMHDVEVAGSRGDQNEKTEAVAVAVDKLAKKEDLVVIGSVELKKNQQRRPILDDICGSRRWKFKAKTVLLVYSEVGVQRSNPRIYYSRADMPGEQCSILEVHMAKSKDSGFKGRLFMEQETEKGLAIEVPYQRALSYAGLIS